MIRRTGFALTSVTLSFSLFMTCGLVRGQTATPLPIQGEQPTLGAGYMSIGDEVVGKCIDYPNSAVQSAGGATATFSLTTFNNSTSIRKEFSLDGAASFGFGMFNGSLATSYMESSQFSRYETYLHVLVQATQATQHIDSSKVTLAGIDRFNPWRDQQRFLARCGDKFLSAIQTGGSFEAIVSFETETSAQQTTLDSSLSAAGFLNSDVSLKQRLSQAITSSNAKSTVKYIRTGVSGDFPQSDLPTVIDYARTFPTLVKSSPKDNSAVMFSSLKYSAVNISVTEIDASLQKMDELAELYEGVLKIKGGIDYVKSHPNEFSPRAAISSTDTVLVSDTIASVRQRATECKADYNKCDSKSIQVPKIRLPERLVWLPIDETNINYQSVGSVPTGEQRVLEAKGVWNCGPIASGCWQNAANSIAYQVLDAGGHVVQSGITSNGTALISVAGDVRVRVGDGPGVPEFKDNTHDPNNPPKAAVW